MKEKEIKEWDALRQYIRFGKIGKLHNLLLEEQIEKGNKFLEYEEVEK